MAFSLSNLFNQALAESNDAGEIRNSQTMMLLSPAVNLDPNPSKGNGGIMLVGGIALQAQEGPSGTAADISEWPTSSQISIYTVRDGDTLSGIAKMFGVSVNTIAWANDIQRGLIRPGQTLIILPITGVRHSVAKGETISSIAKKFKADANEIAQYNGLTLSDILSAGTTIIIPNGEVAQAQSSRSMPGRTPVFGGSGPTIDGYYIWPVAGGVITQHLHGWNAIDIGAPRGTSIYAAASGIVLITRSSGWNGGYGNYVVIRHSNGTQTLYSHADKILVTPGESVVQGQAIALIGSTGQATGSHLHFEVRGAKNPFD